MPLAFISSGRKYVFPPSKASIVLAGGGTLCKNQTLLEVWVLASHVEEWAGKRDPVIAGFAIFAASSCEMVLGLLQADPAVTAEKSRKWAKYYTRPRRFWLSVAWELLSGEFISQDEARLLGKLLGFAGGFRSRFERIRKGTVIRNFDLETLESRGEAASGMLSRALAAVQEGASDEGTSVESLAEANFPLATHFFLSVWAPCWIINRCSIRKLVEQADTDFDSLLAILEVDKFALENREVRTAFLNVASSGNERRMELIGQAIGKNVRKSITLFDVKIFMASLIYHVTSKWSQARDSIARRFNREIPRRSMGPKAIYDLFNAVAKDRTGNEDNDLQEDFEAFKKMLKAHTKRFTANTSGRNFVRKTTP